MGKSHDSHDDLPPPLPSLVNHISPHFHGGNGFYERWHKRFPFWGDDPFLSIWTKNRLRKVKFCGFSTFL